MAGELILFINRITYIGIVIMSFGGLVVSSQICVGMGIRVSVLGLRFPDL